MTKGQHVNTTNSTTTGILPYQYLLPFQGKYYEQVQGAAMGSPISPLIANLFMEEFEAKALTSCPHPPSLWLMFVDDTFVITNAEHSQPLLPYINKQDPQHPIYS